MDDPTAGTHDEQQSNEHRGTGHLPEGTPAPEPDRSARCQNKSEKRAHRPGRANESRVVTCGASNRSPERLIVALREFIRELSAHSCVEVAVPFRDTRTRISQKRQQYQDDQSDGACRQGAPSPACEKPDDHEDGNDLDGGGQSQKKPGGKAAISKYSRAGL